MERETHHGSIDRRRFSNYVPNSMVIVKIFIFTGEAGYRTLLLAVYKTSLFFRGSEVAGYKTSLFFPSSQVAVYKTLLFSESPNLHFKVFFQIWLTIRPLFIFARHLMRGLEGSYGQV